MNIQEVLDELGISYKKYGEHHHISSLNWIGIDCPFCSPGMEKYRMGINVHFNYASCWICGAKPLYEVLRLSTGREAGLSSLLKQLTRVRVESDYKPTGKLVLPSGLEELLPAHRKYLESRRLDPDELVRLWSLKGLGRLSRTPWRIFIPIFYRGEMVSWSSRSIGEGSQRYINAKVEEEKLPAKSILFGMDHCRHAIIVVEGFFDAMRIGYGAAAVMGLAYSRAQLNLISKFPVRCVIFDNSPDAQGRADRLCEDLSCFEGTTHRVELDSSDPGEASKREVKLIRKHFLED